jgi:hypothetical protein
MQRRDHSGGIMKKSELLIQISAAKRELVNATEGVPKYLSMHPTAKNALYASELAKVTLDECAKYIKEPE